MEERDRMKNLSAKVQVDIGDGCGMMEGKQGNWRWQMNTSEGLNGETLYDQTQISTF